MSRGKDARGSIATTSSRSAVPLAERDGVVQKRSMPGARPCTFSGRAGQAILVHISRGAEASV